MKQAKTKTVKIGKLKVGGSNPIRIKAMLKTPTGDLKNLVRELRQLEAEGAEAVRLAVRDPGAAKLYSVLRKASKLPLVADIHFDYKLALLAIEEGFEAIRLNPLNIYKPGEVKEVVAAAKANKVPIRIGVNSGGFRGRFNTSLELAKAMLGAACKYLKTFESRNFFEIMVSFKASDVRATVEANRLFAKKFQYPLHLGVTATGPILEGAVKSSLGLGALLYEGIGDIIRVSLTAPSFWEVRVAKQILQNLSLRRFGPEIISCPTCSRCEVNLIDIVDRFKKQLEAKQIKKPLEIALMGCVVNGPGEASQADIGAAFGKRRAVIFKGGKILKQTNQNKVIKDLLRGVAKHGSK